MTSLIKAGARPELNGGCDIITECIRPYQSMLPGVEITSGSQVDNLKALIKHGAKVNEVQRAESGVTLTSHSMRLLLSMNILPLTWSSEYVRLVILPLVHGAVVDSTCIMLRMCCVKERIKSKVQQKHMSLFVSSQLVTSALNM